MILGIPNSSPISDIFFQLNEFMLKFSMVYALERRLKLVGVVFKCDKCDPTEA